MSFALLVCFETAARRPSLRRVMTLESLDRRETMDADTSFGPHPAPVERRSVVEFNWGDAGFGDDARRAAAGAPRLAGRLGLLGPAGTERVAANGGQAAANLGGAATEIVNGGQAAILEGAATEVVNGGQAAAQAAAGPFDHLPRVTTSPEYDDLFRAHLDACQNGDSAEALRTLEKMRAEELLEFPDGRRIYKQSGAPYVPAAKAADAVEAAADAGAAGRRLAGKVLGAVGTAADFLVDPVIGTIFYDENLATGESVFGRDSYLAEAYANLQVVPLLGGPFADFGADLYTIFDTDWAALFVGPDEGADLEERKAAVERYRDLENRKDYDANHGNQYQEDLWNEVLKAKDELRAMGIDPDKVR